MSEENKRLEELEKYQNRIVVSIKELNLYIKDLQDRINKLEDEKENLGISLTQMVCT